MKIKGNTKKFREELANISMETHCEASEDLPKIKSQTSV
jgi:hypothetical protein